MKRMNLKALLTMVLVAVLLTFAVSGTIAYLIAKTDEVENIFNPSQVDTEIVEVIENDAKTSIAVTNPENVKSVDAYVRVAVTGNWCDKDGKIVKQWTPSFEINTPDWEKYGSYYYYTKVLEVGDTTSNLLKNGVTIAKTSSAQGYEGLHLEVTVMQQAIQAEGKTGSTKAVVDIWGIDPESL